MRIPIQFEVEQMTVMGILHIPENGIKLRHIVVMCYGFNGYRSEVHRMSVKFGDFLAARGIATVRLDYRGQGISEGAMEDVCLASRVKDICGAIDFIRGCFDDPLLPVDLIGFSDGARIAAKAAEYRAVNALIFWNPIFETKSSEYSKSARGRRKNTMFRNVKSAKWNYLYYGLPVNTTYLQELMKGLSVDSLANNSCKKYCIWGADDRFTKETRSSFEPFVDAQSIIGDAAHLFFGEKSEQAVFEATYGYLIDKCPTNKTQ